jgi:hypothetical protein
MINSKTVFVLGAGASYPFGYPLGAELYQSVVENLRNGRELRMHLLNATRFTSAEVDQFLSALSRSGQTSVDAFLERRHEEFLDIGKAAMAADLILREHDDALWRQPNWMLNLYDKMSAETLEQFGENQVSFVTFNYDRSLEHFLCTSLSNNFGRRLDACAKVLASVPIVHLHGRLGYLPWQNKNGRAYGDRHITVQAVEACVREMRVVHEDITDRDKDFTEAKQLLKDAKRVYLMGFGFGAKNVERIGLESLKPEVFYGTAYGLTSLETADYRRQCGGRVTLYNEYPCLEFLRHQFAGTAQ